MLFLFNGITEMKNGPTLYLTTKKDEQVIKAFLVVESKEGHKQEVELFNCKNPYLMKIIEDKCVAKTKDTHKLSRRCLSSVDHKVIFQYKTREAISLHTDEHPVGFDKYYGRSIIAMVNPGHVRVFVDRRNFGAITHQYIPESNVTVSILMPKWSRWWKLKHPVYIETSKFDTRISLLSLGYLEKDEIKSNIIKAEPLDLEIPEMKGVVKEDTTKPAPKKPYQPNNRNGFKKPFKPNGQNRGQFNKNKSTHQSGTPYRGKSNNFNQQKPGNHKPFNKNGKFTNNNNGGRKYNNNNNNRPSYR